MDNKEKAILISTVSSVLVLGCYSLYVYNFYIAENWSIVNDFKFWGKAFLILIPLTIVAQIVIIIIFSILNKIITSEDLHTIADERDKLIELKAIRISHWTFIFGFLLAMGSQAFEMQVWVMFVILILSGFTSSLVSDFAKIYYYRKGF